MADEIYCLVVGYLWCTLILRCPKHVLILPEGQSSTVYKSDGIHIFSGCIFVLNKISNKKVLLNITWYRCMARGFLLQ